MMEKSRVLVTGGAGYIGSHAVRCLLAAGHEVVVVDDLSNGHRSAVDEGARFVQANIADHATIYRLLMDHGIEAVMHFAAFIEVGHSVQDPKLYYENNLSRSLVLFNTMLAAKVKRLIFSSTAAVYGHPHYTPMDEEHPRGPVNPYGRAKNMVEDLLADYAQAYGLGYVAMRYFNVAGATPGGAHGECHNPETHLIPRVLAVAAGNGERISVYGTDYPTPDGTCIRDYVHVEDLVAAHVLALDKAQAGGGGHVYNLGSEHGFSVRQVIEVAQQVTGRSLPVQEMPRRQGDPAVLVATSQKIRQACGWQPRFPELATIVEHAWQWHGRHPQGYR